MTFEIWYFFKFSHNSNIIWSPEIIENDPLHNSFLIEKVRKDSNIDNEKLDRITRKIVGDLLRNPMYKSLKNKFIVYRKLFIKDNLNKPISEGELSISFKKYLEKSLDIKNIWGLTNYLIIKNKEKENKL